MVIMTSPVICSILGRYSATVGRVKHGASLRPGTASTLSRSMARSSNRFCGVQSLRPPLGQWVNLQQRCLSTGSVLLKGDPHNPEIDPEEEKYIVHSPYSSVEIPEINLTEFVFRDVEKYKDNVALVSQKYCAI